MQKGESARQDLRSRRGLDWLVFFVADIQTGFGPFVAVFLTTQKWTQVDIGLLLTVSSLVGLLGQISRWRDRGRLESLAGVGRPLSGRDRP